MLSLFRSKPKIAAQAESPVILAPVDCVEAEPVRRMKQQNIKASKDCITAFAAIAKALGLTKAELFEDLVAERLESLRRQGVSMDLA